ncbi:MAG: right-handed parallel beta-helix repeat-containing protein [Syntrophobacteraceae bacterium]
MRGIKWGFTLVAAMAILMACNSQLFAQATRTWVSGVGDDVNPCSRTAPCKTFAGAISKTAAGGEINALDPGGYGGVTITKSLTIDGGGHVAGVLVMGSSGITVNAGENDQVVLRGLLIDGIGGAGAGLKGVAFNTGDSLTIENCTILNFADAGVAFEPTGKSQLFLHNSTITNTHSNSASVLAGVRIVPTATGAGKAVIEKCRIEGNTYGVHVLRSNVTIHDSVISGNKQAGVYGQSKAGINLEDCVISNNRTSGVIVNSATAVVRASNNTIMDNFKGLSVGAAGGSIISFGNNKVEGNAGGDGAPTGAATMK